MANPAPFGLVVPGRPVLADPTNVSPTQFAFSFPSTPAFSHIVLFMIPGTVLPVGMLAGLYLQLPNSTEFKFLGAIGSEKPTAIFKVSDDGSDAGTVENAVTDLDASTPAVGTGAGSGLVTVGISIEPAQSIMAQLEMLKSSSSTTLVKSSAKVATSSPVTTKLLAQRIIKNAFNFLSSFAGSTTGGQEVVPLKSFQDWWTKFERRIEVDPGFLERAEQD